MPFVSLPWAVKVTAVGILHSNDIILLAFAKYNLPPLQVVLLSIFAFHSTFA